MAAAEIRRCNLAFESRSNNLQQQRKVNPMNLVKNGFKLKTGERDFEFCCRFG